MVPKLQFLGCRHFFSKESLSFSTHFINTYRTRFTDGEIDQKLHK